MKKKIISIFLSMFIVVSSTVSSFAFAPALLLAPEVASLIGTILVAGGLSFQTYDDLSKGVAYYANDEGFIDKVLPSLMSSVNKFKDGTVELSADVLDYFESVFIGKGSNIYINGLSVNSFPVNQFADIQSNKHLISDFGLMKGSIYTIPLISDGIVHINKDLYFDVTFKEGTFSDTVATLKYGNDVLGKYRFSKYGGVSSAKVTFVHTYIPGLEDKIELYNYSGLIGNSNAQWRFSGSSEVDIYDYLSGKGALGTFDNVGDVFNSDAIKDNSICVSPPKDASDLLAGSNYNVYNPSARTWEVGDSISFPATGALDIGDSISVGKETATDTDVDTDTDTTTDTDIDGSTDWSDVFPPWGEGINFKPLTEIGFTEKFPFCLARDIKNVVGIFNVKPKAPIFEVPLFTEKIKIDLSQFNDWANIIRLFVFLGFIICLINITRKVIG